MTRNRTNEIKISRQSEVLVYQNQFLRLFDDNVKFPGGAIGTYLRIEWMWPYNVAIVPVTSQGKVLLINQFCYARQEFAIQIPKGMGDATMSAAESAERELLEEIGGHSVDIQPLRTLYSDPGLIANPMHVFVAWDVELRDSPQHEPGEAISCILEKSLDDTRLLDATEDAITIASLALTRELRKMRDVSA